MNVQFEVNLHFYRQQIVIWTKPPRHFIYICRIQISNKHGSVLFHLWEARSVNCEWNWNIPVRGLLLPSKGTNCAVNYVNCMRKRCTVIQTPRQYRWMPLFVMWKLPIFGSHFPKMLIRAKVQFLLATLTYSLCIALLVYPWVSTYNYASMKFLPLLCRKKTPNHYHSKPQMTSLMCGWCCLWIYGAWFTIDFIVHIIY